MLAPTLASSAAPNDEHVDDDEIVEELADVLYRGDLALQLVLDAGVPRARIPVFTTALAFWTCVATEARSGMLHDGIRPIIETAALRYPANPVFARYLCSPPPRRGGRRTRQKSRPDIISGVGAAAYDATAPSRSRAWLISMMATGTVALAVHGIANQPDEIEPNELTVSGRPAAEDDPPRAETKPALGPREPDPKEVTQQPSDVPRGPGPIAEAPDVTKPRRRSNKRPPTAHSRAKGEEQQPPVADASAPSPKNGDITERMLADRISARCPVSTPMTTSLKVIVGANGRIYQPNIDPATAADSCIHRLIEGVRLAQTSRYQLSLELHLKPSDHLD